MPHLHIHQHRALILPHIERTPQRTADLRMYLLEEILGWHPKIRRRFIAFISASSW
jgi:hypothetical protein